MEYFILNKKQKIPSLGFKFTQEYRHELNYHPKYNILTTDNLILYLDFNNNYNEFDIRNKKNFFIVPHIKNIHQLQNLNKKFQFIIIDFIDLELINYCNKNNIFPILIFNYQKFKSNHKNLFLKNFNIFNQEILIKFLIEYGIIIICENRLKNFKFDLYLGEIFDNLINKIKL